jgi:outer membrane beta-barrel protein
MRLEVLTAIPFMALLAAAPSPAWAQELPGLDLSEPAPQSSPERAAEPEPEPGLDLAEPRADDDPADAPGGTAAAPLGPGLGAPTGERDAALADRVKAVQRRGFLKRGRLELGANLPVTVNDAFFQKVGASGRLGYHFRESFALMLRGGWYWPVRTGRIREGKVAFSSQLLSSQIDGQLMLDAMWSPVYGKVAWLGKRIVHFDLFFLAGFGGVWSATSGAPRNLGPHLAADVGTGLRFYPADWLALEGGVSATFYPDQPVVSAPSSMQRVISATVGASIFFPFRFEYARP